MLALVFLFAVPSSQASAPAGGATPSGEFRSTAAPQPRVAGAEPSRYLQLVTQRIRHGVSERRLATWKHQDWLGQERTRTAYRERDTRSVPYLRWLRHLWSSRAHRLWKLRAHTLRDFSVAAGSHAWLRAVEEVQKVFPGTSSWLISCSASEGGHGRWVTYGGGSYYPGFEHNYVVGGHLQFKWPTFKGFYRHALGDVLSRGYLVPADLRDPGDVRAWRSALGQALAGAWALRNGLSHHWVGSGCG